MKALEYTTDDDIFYDFCLWEYKPSCAYAQKLRSVNLLFHSFDIAGVAGDFADFVQLIRKGIGVSHTVWGVKNIEGKLHWEYYFYDYQRRERKRSITRILEVIRPFTTCDIDINENIPYFMFSIDVTDELIRQSAPLQEIHVYIGNPGSTVSSGICYSMKKDSTQLENFYFFFDVRKHMNDILNKAFCSVYTDSVKIGIDQIFPEKLRNCKIIVVANKQNNDAVYFSRINVDQLIYFLKIMKYPIEIVSYIEDNRQNLDHLLFDVGFDYRLDNEGFKILKSGYYGFF